MTPQQSIRTPRLRLVAATVPMAKAAADGDLAAFSQLLDAHVPPEWPPEIMADAQGPLVEQLKTAQSGTGSLAWYITLIDKKLLVGFAGFKGTPRDGRIDIGYAILDAHQKQGYATEAVNVLSHFAFMDPRVQRVVGETLPGLTASIRVMEKCGYTLVGTDVPGHDGEESVVQYELKREQLFGDADEK